MTRQEATAIVAELAASYSGIRLSADRAKVYEDALLPLPTQQTRAPLLLPKARGGAYRGARPRTGRHATRAICSGYPVLTIITREYPEAT